MHRGGSQKKGQRQKQVSLMYPKKTLDRGGNTQIKAGENHKISIRKRQVAGNLAEKGTSPSGNGG